MAGTILEVVHLRKYFHERRGLLSGLAGRARVVPAVDDVSFYIKENETLGLVGESGCGKTTVGRSILGLTPPTSGSVLFEGKEITALPPEELRRLRSRMQMIFQDLDAALNPKMRVREILAEAVTVHREADAAEIARRSAELLDQVNLKESKLASFPDELSGGEKRRVGIARALAVGARFLVADEPTSALDVSIQAQVVNLLADLQKRLRLSYLFISHDLRVVEIISRKVAVMYLGKIVETGLTENIATSPRHPYTAILWSSLVDKRSVEASRRASGAEDSDRGVLDFDRPAAGCPFAPRCPVHAERGRPAVCTDPESAPILSSSGAGHQVACHFPLS
jgi:oligopeptide/dipeptide ABC transporter ATP-binding protein